MSSTKPCCVRCKTHPRFFFESGDPGQESTVRAFQKECHLLSELKHPMIVQYLGVHYDRGTRSSITLLMELMDENLQSYLERHADVPLPYCREVKFACDVAWHSNTCMAKEFIIEIFLQRIFYCMKRYEPKCPTLVWQS